MYIHILHTDCKLVIIKMKERGVILLYFGTIISILRGVS